MIKRLHIRNFRAIEDLEIELERLHVLIGQNDSGKTSVLEALYGVHRLHRVSMVREAFCRGAVEPADLIFGRGGREATIMAVSTEAGCKPLVVSFDPGKRSIDWWGESSGERGDELAKDGVRLTQGAKAGVGAAMFLKPDPGKVQWPVAYSDRATDAERFAENGFGLARFLDYVLGTSRASWDRFEGSFLSLFPSVKAIQIRTEQGMNELGQMTGPGKGIYVLPIGSDVAVPARMMSTGMLLALVYLALPYLPEPPDLLLLEEPEWGLHPALLTTLVEILRKFGEQSPRTQVVMTTQSPYLVDLFGAHEVTVCGRDAGQRVIAKRLSDIPEVVSESRYFQLGEIWGGKGEDVLLGVKSPGGAVQ